MEYTIKKQGLYDPSFEHDACGIGAIINIDGKQSHAIVDNAIHILENMMHRGASGADEQTGDGAGILVQIPDSFFRRECQFLNIELPKKGDYGVIQMFVHKYPEFRAVQMKEFKAIVLSEGQVLLGWREVPINASTIGKTAKESMPFMIQALIQRNGVNSGKDFERTLYVIRRKAEKKIIPLGYEKGGTFYIASASSKTIVYKGMLTALQLRTFYLDLSDLDFKSSIALVHSRFSTNTFPSWERAHPNRYIIHNGEINTIRGNVNWMKARQKSISSELFATMEEIYPIIDETGSDSSMFDNALEFLHLTGKSLPHAMMLMIPEPWEKNEQMSDLKKEFYKFNNFLMEPWEGPAAMAFTDGEIFGATLDRTGLRPSRYYVTKGNDLILSSEVGVLKIPPQDVKYKGRLQPGKILVVDINQKRIIPDEEMKHSVASEHPYKEWNEKHIVTLANFETSKGKRPKADVNLRSLQKSFGYTYEDIHDIITPMAMTGKEQIGAMGVDTPLAVLSEKPKLLFSYFKQLFAQVTNPPIDGLRENSVTSSTVLLGSIGNILAPHKGSKSSMMLEGPILSNGQLKTIKEFDNDHFKTETISLLYKKNKGTNELEVALKRIFGKVDRAIDEGKNLFLLSDRGVNSDELAIPTLLAASGLHHHLIRNEIRTDVGIVVETAEAREVHHFATLFGYGVTAINPYLAFETIKDLTRSDFLGDMSYTQAKKNYIKASVDGLMKVITKMGISTLRSYHGSQIFEAVGIRQEVIDEYFTNTISRIEGIGLREIAEENQMRHDSAFVTTNIHKNDLDEGGVYKYKATGEEHYYNPKAIYLLQQASRQNDYTLYKQFSHQINKEQIYTLRNLLDFQVNPLHSIPIEEVESVEQIVKRFKSGAMSYGSLSKEAHETLANAMNILGGKSNSGEGGEDQNRFVPVDGPKSLNSAIKQVASGRFGVTSLYLNSAKEIQIKIAQGAKPGEGGHLPGSKVYPEIARVRHSTPGVGLISPPPHHDIYSIEDLAQLIHDLKMANDRARINVKLVSEVGVGTVAAGVTKGKADVILISGYDGGTGASPQTSIHHAGLPWELGLAEVQQTLLLNKLRDRVVIETDGKLLTGIDVIKAALLGAEEFGFATAPLITMGCIMMRVCHLNSCPVGVATQNKTLRKNFSGKPEYVVNYYRFVAQEMREIMAKLGVRTIQQLVGRTDLLKPRDIIPHWKASHLDLSNILYTPYAPDEVGRSFKHSQNHRLEDTLDRRILLHLSKDSIENQKTIRVKLEISNTDRVVGAHIGSLITQKYGETGLHPDTINFDFVGSAGQSFGAFIPKGITLALEGDANDYVGKGCSGGKIIVYPPRKSTLKSEENIIIGNVAFYGATSGEAYISGIAGERFCVRNSGIEAVVEGVGDHGCEYMTGGTAIILGETGSNFAAGMSGGVVYCLDLNKELCNPELIEFDQLSLDDENYVVSQLKNHISYTNSEIATLLLQDWEQQKHRFTKIIPKDYKIITQKIQYYTLQGLSHEEATETAFRDVSREEGE